MKVDLSIIIPVYNVEKYIVKCINSIICQNVEGIEVLCVDDGSTDESALLINNCCSKNSCIKYIYQDNAGAPKARNNGLLHAEGRYCMFFDADDILFSGSLKKMMKAISESGVDMVVGDYVEINADDKEMKVVTMQEYYCSANEKWSCSLCPPLPGNKIIRKAVLDKSKLKFEDLKIGQDLNFYLKLLSCCEKVICLNEKIMGYRILDGSISRQYTLKILNIRESIDDVRAFYVSKHLENEYNKHISIVELIAYRSQLEKLRFFEQNGERNEIKSILGRRQKRVRIRFDSNFVRYVKEKIKIRYLLLIF